MDMAETIYAGVAEVEITPTAPGLTPTGIQRPELRGCTDPLMGRALVLSDGLADAGASVAFVTVDLNAVRREVLVEPFLRALAGRVPLEAEQILVTASHTHSGPDIFTAIAPDWRGDVAGRDNRPESLQARAAASRAYFAGVAERLADAVVAAWQQRVPVEPVVGIGMEREVAANSRYILTDGTAGWVNFTRDEIVGPSGPTDYQVGVLGLRRPGGEWLAVLYNFAMHALTRDGAGRQTSYSADYPGYVAQLLRRELGAVGLFTPGACGNVHGTGFTRQQTGERLGTEIVRVLRVVSEHPAPAGPFTPIRFRRRVLEIPYRPYTEAHLEEVHRINQRWGPAAAEHEKRFIKALELLKRFSEQGPAQVPVHAVALGKEVAFVSVPVELFVEYGIEIKAKSPFRYTFVLELTNDGLGYAPTRNAFRWGSYQTWVGSTLLALDAGERMAAAGLELLEELWQA
jgi:neutral ceramidase